MEEKKKTELSADAALKQAKQDIDADPDLQITPASDDLDEGELARKDNSDEKAFDALEKPRNSFRKG